jgi:uncharacterized protein
MATELQEFIAAAKLYNTHEHMVTEDEWLADKPDVLRELFDNYASADLMVARRDEAALKQLFDTANPDIARRFSTVREQWEASQFTGCGEAVRLAAQRFFGIEQIDAAALVRAQEKLPARWPAGDRLRILRDEGLYDHIQTDDFSWPCRPDKSGLEFFLYDLSWANFACGDLQQRRDRKLGKEESCEGLFRETGIDVTNLERLREALTILFDKYAPLAVAVKSQHAYARTLLWQARSDDDAARALQAILRDPGKATVDERNCLGDWCLARGVELATKHNLPFKIHCGYYAGYGYLNTDFIKSSNLCALLRAYPAARFILMHIAWPYDSELVGIAKHFPNVTVDMCWAWCANPHTSGDFVRRFIHAAPINKLFIFGGDTFRPRMSVAYAMQTRKWLTRALEAEIADGELTEPQAMIIARRVMQDNQREAFDLEGLRRRLQDNLAQEA